MGVQMRLDAAEDGTWMIQRLEVRKSIAAPTTLEELPFLENVGLVFRAAAVGSLTMSRYARIASEQMGSVGESSDYSPTDQT